MSLKSLVLSISLLVSICGTAQISQSDYQKIDSLFIEWNRPSHPGGVIGIMKNSKLIFSKAYGLSSLEYLVPNSTETIFNTASVSKQFTAMGIVLLDIRGKLSIDDDIRKYIPELHDFGETITIRHMLHHTSGFRSLHAMLELAGWRSDDSRTNKDLFRFMKKQDELNFKPGEEYLYCNSGYILMTKIIETVTKEKFKDWMKKSIFEPLGMVNTYVEDNYMRVVRGNATSYRGSYGNKFNRAVEYWGYTGSGNMHSTTNDLLLWSKNFYEPKPNWEKAFELLKTVDKLNNGEVNNYAFGVNIGEYKGLKTIQHGGAIGGFRSNLITYPDEKLSIAILTNFSSSSVGQKANKISEILLKNVLKENKSPSDINSIKGIELSNKVLKKFVASYWNNKGNYVRKIYLKDDTLRYFRSKNSESPLIPIGNNKFQMSGVQVKLTVKFETEKNTKKKMIVQIDNDPLIISESFEPVSLSSEQMISYTGSFFSPELETTYYVSVKDDKLVGHHPRHGDFSIKVLKKDVLEWPFGTITKYERDENDKIEGIRISNGRAKNVRFEKVKILREHKK